MGIGDNMELITICAWCKTETNRQDVEYSSCGVTHGICVYCQQKYFPQIFSAPNVKDTTGSTQEIGQLHNVGSG